ncbi:6,7-dimethyl-8-ribityllumazine synthase, partial [Lysobacter sp. 2RAB21]
MPHYEGDLRSPPGARYAIIASRWNPRITDTLVAGARKTFAEHGVTEDAIDVIRVPGAWELPVAGWTEDSGVRLEPLLTRYAAAGLRHLLCTDVSRDGTMTGPNLDLYRHIHEIAPDVQLQASGGIRDIADIVAADLPDLQPLLGARELLRAFSTLFHGGEESVMVRLLVLRAIGERGQAPDWTPQELREHFAYLEPVKFDTVIGRLRDNDLLLWDNESQRYRISPAGRQALSAIGLLLQFNREGDELAYVTAQIAAGQAVGRVRPDDLQHLLSRLNELREDFDQAVLSGSEHRILRAAAVRLQETVGAEHTVARLGGDEFTVVLENLDTPEQAEDVARRLIKAFEAPLDFDQRHDVAISPSIGISIYPDHAQVPTDLLKHADTAMYQAKAAGRRTFMRYTEAMDIEIRQRATISAALRKVLDRNELRLVFQPRLSLPEARITGVEALLRWQSAEYGNIPPTQFIPLAEESGLILEIGEWAMREACNRLRLWRLHGLD